jgi:ferredoxin
MTHVITSLCLRDAGCVPVCPVECIVPGKPIEEWPLFYIDPDTCIDCGACIPECPYSAIFPEDDLPKVYRAVKGYPNQLALLDFQRCMMVTIMMTNQSIWKLLTHYQQEKW